MPTLYDELAAHRDKKKSKKDKRVFGLVLQGGGMRAVYSAAAIVPLLGYGFQDCFDHVVGSSAGAINGAYFLGGHKETPDCFTDDLTNKNFVNLLRTDKIVDIDYVVDTVLKYKYPLNFAALQTVHAKLHIILTNARTGAKEIISNHRTLAEIYEEFRATAALPILYNRPVKIGDKTYIDGGVSDALPVDVAIKLGCTDIVVVMTQRIDNYHFDRAHQRLIKHLMKRFAKRQPAAIRRILPTNERVLKLNLHTLRHPTKKVRIYLVEPSDEEFLITLATIDKPKVEELARLGVQDMDRFLHQELV